MISTFVLLTVLGGVCRLGLNWILRRKLGVYLGLPPILALALVILTGLPDILSPVSIKLPLGLVLGLLLLRHCQKKPPCPTMCRILAFTPCLNQYPSAISKPALRSSNWQLCFMLGFHSPFRRREKAMLRFRRMHGLQKFASIHASFHNLFNSQRSLTKRSTFKLNSDAALNEWRSLVAS